MRSTIAQEGTATDYILLEADTDLQAVLETTVGSPTYQQLRDAHEAAIALMASDKGPTLYKWLADVQRMGVLDVEASDYINEEVAAQTSQQGLKYLASVVPADVFGEMAVDAWTEAAAQAGITGKLFTSVEEARAWLAQQ